MKNVFSNRSLDILDDCLLEGIQSKNELVASVGYNVTDVSCMKNSTIFISRVSTSFAFASEQTGSAPASGQHSLHWSSSALDSRLLTAVDEFHHQFKP